MTKTICHTILLDLVVVICDLLVIHHPPDQASYGDSRSYRI
jgi:hypothetical protein